MDKPKSLEEMLNELAEMIRDDEKYFATVRVSLVIEKIEQWLKQNREQWELTDNSKQADAITDLLENELRAGVRADAGNT